MHDKEPDGVKTASQMACEKIRQKILAGELLPGTKLTRRGMAELSGVSVIPVIEAMYQLEQDGLVESIPLSGSRVVSLDAERQRDVYAMREAVECQVARMLAGKLSAEQASEFRELARQLDEHLYAEEPGMDEGELWRLHASFHAGLAALTACPTLMASLRRVNLFDLLREVVQRNRRQVEPHARDWHGRIIDALMTGDEEHADKVMRHHVRSSLIAD